MNVRTFFQDLYRHDLDRLPRLQRVMITATRFINELRHQFTHDTVVVRASGMAYTSLLALVPLVAVFFSIFTAFSAFADLKTSIQAWVFGQIVPARSDEILNYINKFTSNTKTLGLFSTAFLFITSVLLFDNIEKNFNALWHVKKRRSFMRRFMSFTMVLIWGPMLIGLSFYTSGKLRAFFSAIDVGVLQRAFFGMFPWMITVLAFAMMLAVIPATKVRWKSAFYGGMFGGTIWEFAKIGFSHYVTKSITYSAIYGGLSLIPIFLVWLYLTWIIVLLSVEVSYVHHNYNSLVLHRAFAELSPRERLHLSLRIYAYVAACFHHGKSAPDHDELATRFAVPLELVEEILERFVDNELLIKTDQAGEQSGFVPARSLASLHLQDVVKAAYESETGTGEIEIIDAVDKAVSELTAKGEYAAREVFSRTNLLEMLTRAEKLSLAEEEK